MMLRDTFGLSLEADWAEQSLVRVLNTGVRTADIAEPGKKLSPAPSSRYVARRNAAHLRARRKIRLGRLKQPMRNRLSRGTLTSLLSFFGFF